MKALRAIFIAGILTTGCSNEVEPRATTSTSGSKAAVSQEEAPEGSDEEGREYASIMDQISAEQTKEYAGKSAYGLTYCFSAVHTNAAGVQRTLRGLAASWGSGCYRNYYDYACYGVPAGSGRLRASALASIGHVCNVVVARQGGACSLPAECTWNGSN